jgi:dihydrodipicolinate synthase/N-acetylneuraminate lyase
MGPNDPSSASVSGRARHAGGLDGNHSARAAFAAAQGWVSSFLNLLPKLLHALILNFAKA